MAPSSSRSSSSTAKSTSSFPVEHAAYLHDQLEHVPREIVVIPGAGHNDILPVGYRQYFGAIRDFIARHGA
ncbi:MAG: hypothetical protein U5Q44_11265 [Dehalococcoidia bacterium]|nr:hypothetical protein [Dehalococcoidia bacterium]